MTNSSNENQEISKFKLSDGTIYNIKDEEARKGLEWLLGKKEEEEDNKIE